MTSSVLLLAPPSTSQVPSPALLVASSLLLDDWLPLFGPFVAADIVVQAVFVVLLTASAAFGTDASADGAIFDFVFAVVVSSVAFVLAVVAALVAAVADAVAIAAVPVASTVPGADEVVVARVQTFVVRNSDVVVVVVVVEDLVHPLFAR